MTIEIDDKTAKNYDDTFDLLKLHARSGMPLQEDFKADSIDLKYFELLKQLYQNYRAKINTEEELINLGKRYRNWYVSEKGKATLDFNIYAHFHEVRMRANTLFHELTEKPLPLSQKQTFCKLFELIDCLFGGGGYAKQLKENAGYYLVTGSKNFSAKEIEILNNTWCDNTDPEINERSDADAEQCGTDGKTYENTVA